MSIWQKVKRLFKNTRQPSLPAPVPSPFFLDVCEFPTIGRLNKDPNIQEYTPTGSYYLLGVTTTDRDIVCRVKDVAKAERDYTPSKAIEVAESTPFPYPETVVKFTEKGVLFNLIFVTEESAYLAWEAASQITAKLQLRDKEQRVFLFDRLRTLAKSVSLRVAENREVIRSYADF